METKKFEKAIIKGNAFYKTTSGQKAKKDFTLGYVEHGALGCLDLENIGKMIKERYELFIHNKAKKEQYQLIGIQVVVWTDGNTKREYNLKVNA